MEPQPKVHRQWTIAIRPATGKAAKTITKIASLGGDGFSVLVPCHKARSGFLFKHPVISGRPIPHFVGWDAAVAFSADDNAKLNYNMDGFVEFSGSRPDRITATKDLLSGETTGLGLYSLPLSRPSFGGPIITLRTFGLEQFQRSDGADGLIIFEPGDFYYRNCAPENANTWDLVIYALPTGAAPPIRFDQRRSIIRASIEPLNGPIASVVDLVGLELPDEKIFLGLCVNRFHIPLKSESGWLLSGPGDLGASGRGHVLMGIYPRTELPLQESPATASVHLRPSKRARRDTRTRRPKADMSC